MSKRTHVLAVADFDNMPLGLDSGPNSNKPGLICASNEARFTSSNLSQPLTAYSVGWRDPEKLDELMELLFPSVEVSRRFSWLKADNAAEFLSEVDDIRAIGAPFKRVEQSGTSVEAKTINKGLTVRVDHDEEPEGDFKNKWVGRLLRRLNRNDFRRSMALLDAAATNVAKVWGANSNPDGDLRAMCKAGADISGIRPNVMALGEALADLRMDVYEGQNTPYAGRAAGMTNDDMARKFMVDLVQTVKARYQSTATAKAAIVPSVGYAYLALQGVSKDDPTNVKRFVTPTPQGRTRVYVQEFDKYTDISVEQYSQTVITSTLGIRKITGTAT